MTFSKWLTPGQKAENRDANAFEGAHCSLGAGKSGIAAARLLAEHRYQVTLYDDQATSTLVERLGRQPFEIKGGGLCYDGHSLVVLSPGIPPHSPALRKLLRRRYRT